MTSFGSMQQVKVQDSVCVCVCVCVCVSVCLCVCVCVCAVLSEFSVVPLTSLYILLFHDGVTPIRMINKCDRTGTSQKQLDGN